MNLKYIQNLIKKRKEIKNIFDILGYLFTINYYIEVKIVHMFTYYRIAYVLYTGFILICFLALRGTTNSIIPALGVTLCFLLVFLSISNYIFAKIPLTRKYINHFLGDDFIS